MIWAGQNKGYGSIEEATEFWLGFGMKHMIVKHDEKSFPLIHDDGSLVLESMKKLSQLKEQYHVEYHFHPYNLSAQGIFLTPSIREAHPLLKKLLEDLDQIICDYNFYPLINLHPPHINHPEHHISGSEKKFLRMGEEFFQSLELRARVSLETIHDPYRNRLQKEKNLLGYKPEHFKRMIGNKPNMGLCIDVGHLNMAEAPMNSFLKLPYPIYSVHLHGNDMKGDEHTMPKPASVKDMPTTLKAINACEGPVVFEIRPNNYSKHQIQDCLNYWESILS